MAASTTPPVTILSKKFFSDAETLLVASATLGTTMEVVNALKSIKNSCTKTKIDWRKRSLSSGNPWIIEIRTTEKYLLVWNKLIGEIPIELWNLTRLKELYIGNLSQLVRFDAANYGLSSGDSSGKWEVTLFFQVNGLSGFLTLEIVNLKSLKSMNLSNNMLSGEISPAFVELKNLTLLNLFKNKLTS
ncbi:leucine-rich repeat receptor-like serine/threonine-protein kinase BAM1 [Forsythia ovata]|uniref:Leucine-rich repeat receptor-like serine/threonine-protein kinase BAM1 n=1 Tax=Forsythia ovata TaxID=205694 RepID=A0ABD1U9V2_9LAMI